MTNIFIGAIIGISVTILTILIKKWLDNGCKESQEEIENILKSEYLNKNNIKN